MGAFSTPFSVFLFLSIGAVAVFSFSAVAVWSSARRKERESYYKHELLKKISETPIENAGVALQMLREGDRTAAARRRNGLRIGGLAVAAIGLALMIFLRVLVRDAPVFLCGLLPLLPGLALFAGSYLPGGEGRSQNREA